MATLLAAALVVRAKSPDLELEVTRLPAQITPDGDGEHDRARITFFVRESEPAAGVAIVGRDLEPIRTLDPDVPLEANREYTYVWNGRADDGSLAPVGRYRLRVVLPSRDRDIVFPRRLDLMR